MGDRPGIRPCFSALATAYAEEGNTWHLKPGIGLALETRLFGLHPVRSRIWFEYDVTQKAWQWRVVFAE